MAKPVFRKLVKPVSRQAGRDRGGDGDLADLQQLWDSREAWTGRRGLDPEDGHYEANLSKVLIFCDKNKDWRINWTFTMGKNTPYPGKDFIDSMRVQNQQGLNVLFGRMELLGLEVPTKISTQAISDALAPAEGTPVSFTIRHKDEYPNVSNLQPLADGEVVETETPAEEVVEPTDDIPTKADIKKMKRIELVKLAKEYGLEPKDYPKDDDLKDALIEGLGL